MSKGRFEKIRKHRRREISSKFEWRSCKSKSRFSEFDAKSRAEAFGQRAYQCNLCHQWHLTKMRYGSD
jgi:hypothetical protein